MALVRATHAVYGTRWVPLSKVLRHPSEWTLLDPDDAGSPGDPYPGAVEDDELFDDDGRILESVLPARLSDAQLKAALVAGDALSVPQLSHEADALRPIAPFTKLGVVIDVGPPGAWDAGMVESAAPVFDHESQRYALIYTGYGGTPESPTAPALGIAWADTPAGPFLKDAANPILVGSGTNGTPDKVGVTGCMAVFDGDLWHIFSIGTDAAGYEGGTPSLCYYTTPSLVDPVFTRHGQVIGPAGSGWRSAKTWIGCLVQRGLLWYLFFNATGADTHETIGVATATSLAGPWTVDDAHSPVLPIGTNGVHWDGSLVGQPQVYRIGDYWYMEYFGTDGITAGDGVAWTTDARFPLGPVGNAWAKHPGNPILRPDPDPAKFDGKMAHKPFVLRTPHRNYHYYTAVDGAGHRRVALAVQGDTAAPRPIAVPGVPTDPVLAGLLAALAAAGLIQTDAPRLLIADTFSRPDSATHIGMADTGQTWDPVGGSWGIAGGAAYSSTGGGSVLIDAGAPVGRLAVKLGGTIPGGGQAMTVLTRYLSAAVHYEVVVTSGGGLEIDQYNNGASAVATNGAAGFVTGDTLTVLDDGATITVQRNGTTVLTYATAIAAAATHVGLSVYGYGAGRFGSLLAYAR